MNGLELPACARESETKKLCIAPPTGKDFPVQPLGGFLIVKQHDLVGETTKGGLILADRAREALRKAMEVKTPLKGTVVAIGPGQREQHNGATYGRRPFEFSIGDDVYFRPLGHYELELPDLDGTYSLIGDEDVLAVEKK